MKGDFSRARLDPDENLNRVLLQQGRPLVDSDWNEQIQVLWENIRTILGPQKHGYLPRGSDSFRIGKSSVNEPDQLTVDCGTYVFDGRVIRNRRFLYSTSFRPITNDRDRYEVVLQPAKKNGDPPSLDKIQNGQNQSTTVPNGNYLVALAAQEREWIYQESEAVDPRLAELRAGVGTKMDWRLLLEKVPEPPSDVTDEDKRREIRNGNRGKIMDEPQAATVAAYHEPPPLCVRVPSATRQSAYDRLYRVEVHGNPNVVTTNDNNGNEKVTITLKLTIDNAAGSLPISKVDGGTQITFRASGVDTSQLPDEGDRIEIESKHELPGINGEVDSLRKVIEPRQGDRIIIDPTADDEADQQLTRWQFVAEDIDASEIVDKFKDILEIRFRSIDDVKKLKHGDWWEILIRTAPEDGEFAVRGHRQSPYFASLAIIEVANGKITIPEENGDQRQELGRFGDASDEFTLPCYGAPPVPVAAQNQQRRVRQQHDRHSEPPAPAEPPPEPAPAEAPAPSPDNAPNDATAPPEPRADDSNAVRFNPELLDELLCRRLFPSLQPAAANRWLASAKFGEIALLSRDELFTRIRNDCPSDLYDEETLDTDLEHVVSRRDELLAGRTMMS